MPSFLDVPASRTHEHHTAHVALEPTEALLKRVSTDTAALEFMMGAMPKLSCPQLRNSPRRYYCFNDEALRKGPLLRKGDNFCP
jgi:hypothetical protein